MKQYWYRVAQKIDALSLRERVILFAMTSFVLVTLVNVLLLDPQFARQKQLSQRISQEQSQIANMQAEIQPHVAKAKADPDAENRARLQQSNQQLAQLQTGLRDLQKGLVSPDKISVVLEDILKQNGRLKLVSLRTLPAAGLLEAAEAEAKAAPAKPAAGTVPNERAEALSPADAVYKHGVEIKVKGSYPELVNYLTALEKMPWQLFWANAKLEVGEYPATTLTLTLFTLSLDKKWMNL
ncbi:MAG: MSHA biogenesis protein MshJ [Noviherbaspirillum sp.]